MAWSFGSVSGTVTCKTNRRQTKSNNGHKTKTVNLHQHCGQFTLKTTADSIHGNNIISRIKTKIFIKIRFLPERNSHNLLQSQLKWRKSTLKIIHAHPAWFQQRPHSCRSSSEIGGRTQMAQNVSEALFMASQGLDFIKFLL